VIGIYQVLIRSWGRELVPFVKQARARARARDDESDLSDLRSSDFDAVGVEAGRQGSRVGDKEVEVEAPASPARLKRARVAPARYRD
jgi:hypothetical protein